MWQNSFKETQIANASYLNELISERHLVILHPGVRDIVWNAFKTNLWSDKHMVYINNTLDNISSHYSILVSLLYPSTII